MRTINHASSRSVAWLVAFIAAAAMFRVVRATLLPELPNFSPLMALAFCGGLILPGVAAWAAPLAVLFLSDVALNVLLGYSILGWGQFAAWACMLLAVGTGRWCAFRRSGFAVVAGSLLANTVVFYCVTNAVCWISNPAYPRGLDGLWQSLTIGLPGYPESWTFLRNAVVSDFLFAGLFAGIWYLANRQPSAQPEGARA